MSRPKYENPGSFARILEAGIALADTDSDDDVAWHANEMRLRNALKAHAPRMFGSMGGKARAERMTPERRAEIARQGAQSRWSRRMLAAKQEPSPETDKDPSGTI